MSTIPAITQSIEKVYISMPVDKSANHAEETLVSDQMLIEMYEQYRRPIHSYAYRLLGNQDDADDVTQEVFVRACSSWHGLYEKDKLSSWLYRIATNLCIDMLRKRKRFSWRSLTARFRRDGFHDEETTDDISAFLADTGGIPEIAEREIIQLALANMAAEYAIVLVLHAAQGVSYQEIAEIVDISPNAAATRISRAKRMFVKQYQQLSKDGVGSKGRRQ